MRTIPFGVCMMFACCAQSQVGLDHAVFDDLPWREGRAWQGVLKSDQLPTRGFDMKYLRCAWSLDPAVRGISGSVTSYFTTTAPLDYLLFDLSDTLILDQVLYHGSPIASTWQPVDLLTVTLPNALAAGITDSVTIVYHGVPRASGFGSFATGIHGPDSIPVLWTLSEPYGAKDWWPCKQDLNDKMDSIDVFVTTPSAYRAAGNGLLVSETDVGSNTTYHWRHRHPIAHYLIATAVTNYQVIRDSVFLPDDTIPMLTYAYPEDSYIAGLNAHADVCQQQMPLYCLIYGKYAFADEKYGHAQFGWGGGMEHQTMTFVGGYSYELSAHELAHQWFGDKVTCGSWQDIWLNESFATYSQMLCYNYLAPQYWHGQLRARMDVVTSDPGGSVLCTDTTSVGRIFSGRLSYYKGALVLNTLRWLCGDSAWFHGVRDYLNDPMLAFGSARTSDLQAHLEASSGLDLDGFMADWFTGEGYPTYTLLWTQDTGGHVDLALYQSPSHSSVDFFELPVPIRFKNNDMDSVIVLNNTMNGQAFSFDLPFQADSAIVDPDLWIITGQNIVTRVPELPALKNALAVFPDPAQETLTLRDLSPAGGQHEVDIIDGLGRIVLRDQRTGQHDQQIDIRALRSGCYTLVIGDAASRKRARFVKE